jgi:type I restriction enzyme, S subunit
MKFGLTDKVVEKIKDVFEENSNIDKAIIFGSRAKGNYKPGSDIDIALKGQYLTFDDILKLHAKLDDLNMAYEIDLLNYDTIKEPALKEHIDRAGIVFYERWKKLKLADLITFGNGKVRPKMEGDIPVYGGNGILEYANDSNYNGETIVIGRVGAYCGSIFYENKPIWISDNALAAKPKNGYSAKFLYYFLKDLKLNEFAEGSSHPLVTQSLLNSIDVYVTDNILDQKNIGEVLTSLDDKIDLLQRQNKTLKQLAETLFRQWFVEEAEENWEVLKVSDFAYLNKLAISKNYPFTVIEYLDTGSITEGIIENFETYNLSDAPSRAQRIVKNNDIVYSLVRPIQRHYGLLHNVKENTVVSTGFCVITSKEVSPYFLYLLLTGNDSIDYFDMIAEGSTSAYPSLKPSDIANFKFKKPPEEKLDKFNKVSSDTLNKIKSNTNQIKSLTQLRDTLLPKLISGEVRVKS